MEWRNAAGAVERRSRSGKRGKLPVWGRSGVMKVRSVELEVPGCDRSKFDGPHPPDQAVISVLSAFP